jgi:hypothetical protein
MMSHDHSPQDKDRMPTFPAPRPEFLFLLLTGVFIIFFWVWFFLFRSPDTDAERKAIKDSAIKEILTACNASYGADKFFQPQDIKIRKIPSVEGVSAYVSTLEVVRNDLVCYWDGVNLAQIERLGARGRLEEK